MRNQIIRMMIKSSYVVFRLMISLVYRERQRDVLGSLGLAFGTLKGDNGLPRALELAIKAVRSSCELKTKHSFY